MEACIRRVWLEHPPLSSKASEELSRSLAEWENWKRTRAEQVSLNQVQCSGVLLRGEQS